MSSNLYLILATTPKAGKTTVAEHIATRLGIPHRSTSDAIAERFERERGLPRGTVSAARRIDQDAYRPELIATGDRMAAEGHPPGIVCIRSGARVIEGIRRAPELATAIAHARSVGLVARVICLERPGQRVTDNTEAEGLRALASVVIRNDATVRQLFERVDRAVDAFEAPAARSRPARVA